MRLAGRHAGDGLQTDDAAEQNWRLLKGHALLAQVVAGVEFKEGLQEDAHKIAAWLPRTTFDKKLTARWQASNALNQFNNPEKAR